MNKCAWANNIMVIDTDGYTRPCCMENRIGARISPISTGIKNSWNSKKLIFLRTELDKGFSKNTRPWCGRCEELENLNLPSLRTSTLSLLTDNTDLHGIQFKLSNRCQLACAHCGPGYSSTWAKISNQSKFIQEAIPRENYDLLIDDLKDVLPSLRWIKFTGGEPWMDPLHWKILEEISSYDRSQCSLSYITNGLSKFDSSLWNGWKSVNITVSVDGFEETYEWFRRGANWDNLVKSVEDLSRLDVNLDLSYSITPWTVGAWHKAKDYWKFQLNPTPVIYPWYSSIASLPPNLMVLEDIPNLELLGTQVVDILRLQEWAENWDKIWNTPGWASQLYPWLHVN